MMCLFQDLEAVEVAEMPDDQVDMDGHTADDGKSRKQTVQYSRHGDSVDINDDDDGDDGSAAEGSSTDEESENDDVWVLSSAYVLNV